MFIKLFIKNNLNSSKTIMQNIKKQIFTIRRIDLHTYFVYRKYILHIYLD